MPSLSNRLSDLRKSEYVSSYTMMLLGCLIGGVAYPAFLVPNNIAPGGLTGVATIINYLFGLPVGTVSLLMNLPLFLAGYKTMGRTFFLRSLIATVAFSLCIDLIPLPPVTDDMLLGSIFGGLLLGIGLGLILRGGATTGGTDMLARMVHKHLSFISVGAYLFLFDFLVIVSAAFTMTPEAALYALICIAISSKAVDLVMAGFGTAKACFVVTNHADAIAKRVLTDIDRGATLLDGTGAYSGSHKNILICVVSNRETAHLKRIVKQEDPGAFMFVTDTHETLGEGFGAWGE
ncbi:MAG: YitT family protein [Clostridiales bacterium]|nr:YitT family protein [Clostridiales bacterium]